jgi:hypothetical protein
VEPDSPLSILKENRINLSLKRIDHDNSIFHAGENRPGALADCVGKAHSG